jgi:hypothetical protein
MRKLLFLVFLASLVCTQKVVVASEAESEKPPQVIVNNRYINTLSDLDKYSFQGEKIGTPLKDVFKVVKKKNKNVSMRNDSEIKIKNFKLSGMTFDAYLTGNSELDNHPLQQFCFVKEYEPVSNINEKMRLDAIALNDIFKVKYGNIVVFKENKINVFELDGNPTFFRKWFDDVDITTEIFLKKKDDKLTLWGCVASWQMIYKDALRYNNLLDKKIAADAEVKRLQEEVDKEMREERAKNGAKAF